MNTTTHVNHGSNTVAFLFGAIFNILANTDYASLADYSIKAVLGGIIMMLFKLLGDYISKKLFAKKESELQTARPKSIKKALRLKRERK